MYDVQATLAAIDRNAPNILLLCTAAMLCNYLWFFAAVRQGLRDRVVPIPLFCTLFWLAGDGSMVARYDVMFHQIGHWYVKLFWVALTITVATELVFLWLTIRFGRREYAPGLSQSQFAALVLAGMLLFAVGWEAVKKMIGDPLYIDYFHLANFAGPIAGAAMVARRGTRAGTSILIWAAYTIMVACWFTASALWFGVHFAAPGYLLLYGLCTLSSAAMTLAVSRLPGPEEAACELRIRGGPHRRG